jgi:hypothetical protein
VQRIEANASLGGHLDTSRRRDYISTGSMRRSMSGRREAVNGYRVEMIAANYEIRRKGNAYPSMWPPVTLTVARQSVATPIVGPSGSSAKTPKRMR